MKKYDVQAEVIVYGQSSRRTIYTDGEKLFVKWYGEYVEVEKRMMSYVSVKK